MPTLLSPPPTPTSITAGAGFFRRRSALGRQGCQHAGGAREGLRAGLFQGSAAFPGAAAAAATAVGAERSAVVRSALAGRPLGAAGRGGHAAGHHAVPRREKGGGRVGRPSPSWGRCAQSTIEKAEIGRQCPWNDWAARWGSCLGELGKCLAQRVFLTSSVSLLARFFPPAAEEELQGGAVQQGAAAVAGLCAG